MGIDLSKHPDQVKPCNLCGRSHSYKDRCKLIPGSVGYDFKLGVGQCPHCRNRYKGDTTEPVEVWVPWENRLVWRSCWACFVVKLEG